MLMNNLVLLINKKGDKDKFMIAKRKGNKRFYLLNSPSELPIRTPEHYDIVFVRDCTERGWSYACDSKLSSVLATSINRNEFLFTANLTRWKDFGSAEYSENPSRPLNNHTKNYLKYYPMREGNFKFDNKFALMNKDVSYNKLIEIENKLNWELNNLLPIQEKLNKNSLNSVDAADLFNAPIKENKTPVINNKDTNTVNVVR